MFKQVIVVRSDLRLSKGKTAIQAAHASLEAYRRADKKAAEMWEREGAKKVAVKVPGIKELMDVYNKLKLARIPCVIIKDAGLTEIEPGTITAVGAGPAEEKEIDRITLQLKML